MISWDRLIVDLVWSESWSWIWSDQSQIHPKQWTLVVVRASVQLWWKTGSLWNAVFTGSLTLGQWQRGVRRHTNKPDTIALSTPDNGIKTHSTGAKVETNKSLDESRLRQVTQYYEGSDGRSAPLAIHLPEADKLHYSSSRQFDQFPDVWELQNNSSIIHKVWSSVRVWWRWLPIHIWKWDSFQIIKKSQTEVEHSVA